jgi:[acyl-carrier-protein] S-malonyltransferase
VGTFSLADTAFLLKRRGKAMQRAVPVGQGGMIAAIGLDIDQVKQLAEQATEQARQQYGDDELICVLANDNAPGQVVISGHMQALDVAEKIGNDMGAKKMIRLPVSAPFHSPLMAPAAAEMKSAFNRVQSRDAAVDLVANVTARPVRDADTIVAQLIEQITDPVRWRESVEYMSEQGVSTAVEVGAGRVLSGLIRRIDRSVNTVSLNTPEGLDEFARDYA